MTARTLSIALAGIGHVARYQLAALADARDFQVVGVADIDPSRTAGIAAPTFVDVSQMISRTEPDIVLVSVPNVAHFEVARTVLEAGVHVAIEKPATTTLADFDALGALAEARNIRLHTAFHAAFAPDLLWFLDHRNDLEHLHGPLVGFACGFYDPYLGDAGLHPGAASLEGSWRDSGINALSVVNRLVGPLELESARMTRVPGVDCLQVQATVDFWFPRSGGVGFGNIDTNWTLGLNRKRTTLALGDRGVRIVLDHSAQAALLLEPGGSAEQLFQVSGNRPRLVAHYDGVFADLARAIREGRDNRASSRHLLELLLTAEGRPCVDQS